MNTLCFQVEQDLDPDTEDVLTFIRVLVDGEDLAVFPSLVVCFSSLFRSFYGDGEEFLVTCTCGDPSCAGIDRGVRRERLANGIRWTLFEPRAAVFTFEAGGFEAAVHGLRRQLLELHARDPMSTWNHVPERNGEALALFLHARTPQGREDTDFPYRRTVRS